MMYKFSKSRIILNLFSTNMLFRRMSKRKIFNEMTDICDEIIFRYLSCYSQYKRHQKQIKSRESLPSLSHYYLHFTNNASINIFSALAWMLIEIYLFSSPLMMLMTKIKAHEYIRFWRNCWKNEQRGNFAMWIMKLVYDFDSRKCLASTQFRLFIFLWLSLSIFLRLTQWTKLIPLSFLQL